MNDLIIRVRAAWAIPRMRPVLVFGAITAVIALDGVVRAIF